MVKDITGTDTGKMQSLSHKHEHTNSVVARFTLGVHEGCFRFLLARIERMHGLSRASVFLLKILRPEKISAKR